MSILGVSIQKLGSILQNFLFSLNLTYNTVLPGRTKPATGAMIPRGYRLTPETENGSESVHSFPTFTTTAETDV